MKQAVTYWQMRCCWENSNFSLSCCDVMHAETSPDQYGEEHAVFSRSTSKSMQVCYGKVVMGRHISYINPLVSQTRQFIFEKCCHFTSLS